MSAFRRLILIAVASGTFSGLVWFGLQYFTVIPLIEAAERYETAAHDAAHGASHQHDEGWQPAGGWQRNSFTALATVLTGIGFASILVALVTLARRRLDVKRGALWGLAAFACLGLASRGLTWAPLLAETLACLISGEPPPLERTMLGFLAPERFAARR